MNLRTETKTLGENEIFPMVLQVTAASFVMGLIVQLLKYPLAKIFNQQFFWGIFGQGLFAGGFGLLFYGLACYFLQIPEFMQLKNSFERRWLKLRNLNSTEIIENKE